MLSVVILIAICIAAALVLLWLLLRKFYRKASREMSFVRTGFGGQKVVMSNGALVIPVLHEVIPVNMNTLRLEVICANNQALITKDRMRVDVDVEFFVRVKPNEDAIADAAQTLGRRTTDAKLLHELVEGRFIDALRAVAAEMKMDELHEKRAEFARKVKALVKEDLLKNGLELVSVSLSAMDQTDQSYFNPQNAFDAQGLTALTEVIQARMRRRNEVERDTEVAMRTKDLDAERHKLDLAKEEEFARLEQQREIQVKHAQQQSVIASEQVSKERDAKEVEIAAKQQIDQAKIAAEKSIEEERIARDFLLREKELEKEKAIKISQIALEREALEAEIMAKKQTDQAKIAAEKSIEEERIAKELLVKEKEIARETSIEVADIERKRNIALADQDRKIAVSAKSKEQSASEAEANKARLSAVKTEEQITTARQMEVAERQKILELVESRKRAECEAIEIITQAEARKKAAAEQAEATRIISKGEADKAKVLAEAEAEAESVRAESAEKRYSVDAAGTRALNEAESVLNQDVIAMRVKMAIIQHLKDIIRESVKPMEAIDAIKIFHVEGLNPSAGSVSPESGSGGTINSSLADQLVNSALRYRGQAPLLDAILKDIGISGGDISGFTKAMHPEGGENAAENNVGEDDD
ncbi:MAG: flotillin family protein [Deltaproteobacteria bacterium]|nr:MAG: hypothetical protein B1H13_00230 [Desulfobacteraceae bacterium 4484_190.3]RLB17357.1 MAG: flotillin family protein [Deltaproteobacteria bacterium]